MKLSYNNFIRKLALTTIAGAITFAGLEYSEKISSSFENPLYFIIGNKKPKKIIYGDLDGKNYLSKNDDLLIIFENNTKSIFIRQKDLSLKCLDDLKQDDLNINNSSYDAKKNEIESEYKNKENSIINSFKNLKEILKQ